ncbi:hypothetical protein [Nocardia cyriacigeorgica]|nr:hypothetical protein [Nocardia cyriacigeorgica]
MDGKVAFGTCGGDLLGGGAADLFDLGGGGGAHSLDVFAGLFA